MKTSQLKTKFISVRLTENQHKSWKECLKKTDLTSTQMIGRFINWMKDSNKIENKELIKSIARMQAEAIIQSKSEHELPWEVDEYKEYLVKKLLKR